jgi:hypothetical protein
MRSFRGCALRPRVCESRCATADMRRQTSVRQQTSVREQQTERRGRRRGTPLQRGRLDRSCGRLESPSRRGITARGEGGAGALAATAGTVCRDLSAPRQREPPLPTPTPAPRQPPIRFHSRRGLLPQAPSTGTSPTGQQDPPQQDSPQQDPLQQGFLRQGFLRPGPVRQGPPPSGCRPSASTSRCGRQVVGTTGMASRRLARSLGGSFPLGRRRSGPPRMTGNV